MAYLKERERKSFHQRLRQDKDLNNTLSDMKVRAEELSVEKKAEEIGIPYLNLKFIPINPEALKLITIEQAKATNMLIFQRGGMNLKIALLDVNNLTTKNLLQYFYQEGYNLDIYLISSRSLKKGLDAYKFIQDKTPILKETLLVPEKLVTVFEENIESLGYLASKLKGADISEFMQTFCAGALATRTSDIHLEPKETSTLVRYRVDGVLQDIINFDKAFYKSIVVRIKNLASLMLNITTSSQDGRFSIVLTDEDGVKLKTIDVRVSILPGKNGEVIVMRLLNPDMQKLDVHTFGIRDVFLDKIIRNLDKPQGLVMLSGPTGSGKTTSLYAFLNYINHSDVNIITIEDPIEYRLKSVNQTQIDVKRGYTFASGLRAIMRQDPDVVMVGEIRDKETANIAVNAAITGHLVFSTIHTNDSIGIVTRLKEFGVDTNVVVSSMNLFVAQRLLRRLCPHCKEEYHPDEIEKEKINKALAVISPKSGLTIPRDLDSLYKPVGCPECLGIGYKGRFAIYELFEMKENIADLILKNESEFKVFRKSIENGMITLYQDGVLHSLDGETSLIEVESVAGNTNYIDDLYEASLTSSLSRGVRLKKYKETTVTLDTINQIKEDMSIDEQLQIIMATGVQSKATDIHIEPDNANLIIRFRIDGVLMEAVRLSKSVYPQILGQIKIMSGMRLDIANEIQEGRFTIFGEENFDVRVSIVPGGYGQTIVLRILRSDIEGVTLTELGMDEYNLAILEKEIKKTTGLILVTGPTGAGKSTTLYAALNTINQPGVKIITIEDPIEYKMSGILQTSVNTESGYTFSSALRALLRQNPNVVLIGEIRDKETAEVSIQAAATGHLLLSTLHTNDAASAILRLVDLGVGLTEIATFVNVSVAQRLIRKLDEQTKQKRILTDSEKEILKQKLGIKYSHHIVDFIYESSPSLKNQSGYSGIQAIYEIFVISDEIKKLIPKMTNVQELKDIAIKEGMITLEMAGIIAILKGITDIKEVERVLGSKIL